MSVNRVIQLALRRPKSVPYTLINASLNSVIVGSPSWSTSRSVSTIPIGSPGCRRPIACVPTLSRRKPKSGSSSISTSALIQLVVGSQPTNSIVAILRTRLRPPSQPTR
jgi:hypothetical protein